MLTYVHVFFFLSKLHLMIIQHNFSSALTTDNAVRAKSKQRQKASFQLALADFGVRSKRTNQKESSNDLNLIRCCSKSKAKSVTNLNLTSADNAAQNQKRKKNVKKKEKKRNRNRPQSGQR